MTFRRAARGMTAVFGSHKKYAARCLSELTRAPPVPSLACLKWDPPSGTALESRILKKYDLKSRIFAKCDFLE